ncbi:MAG: MGMT family protein [Candidatus Micrarchaeota archaeon]|nr:MGMT family protein [Candidatus Micrarchaeota archaeon]
MGIYKGAILGLLSRYSLTEFEQKVLANTLGIKSGETISYKELASRSGRPRAARAVGNIMNKNPLPLLIPCHRVVASNHKLGGYAYGVKIKELLLKIEGAKY